MTKLTTDIPAQNQGAYYSFWIENRKKEGGHTLYQCCKFAVERLYLSILKRSLPSLVGLDLLEIGPGTGHFASEAVRSGVNYYAVEKNIKLAQSLSHRGYRVESGPFSAHNFSEIKFDVIYLSHVLEHCENVSNARDLILQCKLKLKKDGVLMINTPNVLDYQMQFYLNDYTHNFITTPFRVKGLLSDLGFDSIDEQKTVFIFKNYLARLLMGFVFRTPLVSSFIVSTFGLILRSKDSSIRLIAYENFSLIAKIKEEGLVM